MLLPTPERGNIVDAVSIPEAAAHLGVSEDTIRRRLRKGELAGHQEKTAQGFRWKVDITTADAGPGSHNGHLQNHADAVLEELVTTLRAQVQAQTEELEARRNEVRELHVLLQHAQALPAPRSRRPWWSRLFPQNRGSAPDPE